MWRTRRLNNRFSHCPKRVAGPRITRPKRNERNEEAYLKTLSEPKPRQATPTPPPQDQRYLTVWSPVWVWRNKRRLSSRAAERTGPTSRPASPLMSVSVSPPPHQVNCLTWTTSRLLSPSPWSLTRNWRYVLRARPSPTAELGERPPTDQWQSAAA